MLEPALDPFEFEILLEIKELKEPVVEQPTSNKNKKLTNKEILKSIVQY